MSDYDRGVYARSQTVGHADAQAVDEGLRAYMLRVYNYMALGIAGTALVTLALMNSPQLMVSIATGPMVWVLFAGILGLGFFAPRLIMSGNAVVAHGAFWLYAGLWGVIITPMVFSFFQVGAGNLVFRALAITATTFAATSFYGYITKKDMSAFGTFFTMATIGLLVAIVVNAIFFQSTMMSLVTSCLVVLLFSAITAWETQEIKQSYYAGDDAGTTGRKAIFGAFMLYGSFITLFIHILNIMGIMRE